MTQTSPDILSELFTQLNQLLPVGIILSDANGKILWCNSQVAEYCGKTTAELLHTPFEKLQSSELKPLASDSNTILISADAHSNHQRWLKVQQTKLKSRDGGEYLASVYTDISRVSELMRERDELNDQLSQLSTVDPVSGLFNHRAMLQNLDPLVSRSRRYSNPLSIIVMDLLNLREFQEQHNTHASNQVILAVSRQLKDQMRWADIVSRVEDDRFVFILPETDRDAATHLAHKLNKQFKDLRVTTEENLEFKVDLCFGVTAWEKGNDAVLLLRRANQALEDAKTNGPQTVETI